MQCHCCSSEEVKKNGRFENKNRLVQRFQCLRCGKTFSEVQPLNETRIDSDKGEQIVHLLCEGMGIDATARLAGVNPHTVLRVLRSAGLHCRELLDAKLRNLKPTHIEMDEAWTFVFKKRIHAGDLPIFGDQYCWLAIDEPTKLICSWQVAKRDASAARDFVKDLSTRVTKDMFDITTDGFHGYVGQYWQAYGAVFSAFRNNVNYGVEMKKYGSPIEQKDARRYSPPVCVSCQRWTHFGTRTTNTITVNHAERQNLNLRLFNKRFCRLTLCFSKKLANLEHSVALYVAFHNFCRVSNATKQTPAQAAGLTDHKWTVKELLDTSATIY